MSSAAADDPVANSPTIFAEHIRYVLDREFERADRSTKRADTIFRSQVAILTVAVAVVVFLYRDGQGPTLDVGTARFFAAAALVAVIALLAAAFGQSIATASSLTDDKTLDNMISEDYWPDDPNALYVTACRDRESVAKLRKSNNKRARIADVALWSQVGSIVLSVAAVGYEVAARIGWT